MTQVPFEQVVPEEQQLVPQGRVPDGQDVMHWPLEQTWVDEQQVVPHGVSPEGHDLTHAPLEHICPAVQQVVPQQVSPDVQQVVPQQVPPDGPQRLLQVHCPVDGSQEVPSGHLPGWHTPLTQIWGGQVKPQHSVGHLQ